MKLPAPPRLSLGQLMTLPFFAAAAMICLLPLIRSGAVKSLGLFQLILFEAILIPIAMALVAQVMLTRGPGRDRVVATFLWVSTLAGILAILAIGAGTLWDIGRNLATNRGLPIDLLAFLIVLAGGLIALNEAAQALRARIVAPRCPNCGRTIAQSGRNRRTRSIQSRTLTTCESCGAFFEQGPDG